MEDVMEFGFAERPKTKILIVDDDEANRATLNAYLAVLGYASEEARSGAEALERVKQSTPDVILLDLLMPGMDGFEVARRLKSSPQTCAIPIIAITALHDRRSNLKAVEAGVDHFLSKPIDEIMLKAHLSNVIRVRDLSREVESVQNRLDSMREYHRRVSCAPRKIIGRSAPMKAVLDQIRLVKDLDAPVLILGESGTGKQLAAETIHWEGSRSCEPFVQVNCANLQESLLESELFGHAKGAFTGAACAKKGLIEVAEAGTLFVDEIGDMSRSVQAKLLVVLDSGLFRRIGETSERRADVRIIAATNCDMADMVRTGEFRSDLFYRINVVSIQLPALRERKEDIPLLAEYFLANSRFSPDTSKRFSDQVMKALMAYDWPGNVRELSNMVERAIVLSGRESEITLRHLPSEPAHSGMIHRKGAPAPPIGTSASPGYGKLSLEEVELLHIREVLKNEKGNRTSAAIVLGISRSTLKKKIAENPLLQKL
jgi:two-component system response regulator HydG